MTGALASFDDLIRAAREQPVWQHFLLVFVRAVLPGDARSDQVAHFESKQGGALVPVMYVDKNERELVDFAGLVAEARHVADTLGNGVDADWDLVVVGCLDGREDADPAENEVEGALHHLVRAIRTGQSLSHLVAFDRNGKPVRFE